MTETEQEQVLALVISTSSGAMQISEQSARLRQGAQLIPDFAHFRTLVIRSMKQAFDLGNTPGMRRTWAASSSWRRIFKHFARLHGIEQAVDIVALDRAGHYECELIDKDTADRDWRELLRLGRKFDLQRGELEALARKAKLRKAQSAMKR